MGRMNIYTVMSGDENNWKVIKADRDFEVEDTYTVSKHVSVCSCFAGYKETCRHRELVKIFQEASAIDSRRYYDYDRKKWIAPLPASIEQEM